MNVEMEPATGHAAAGLPAHAPGASKSAVPVHGHAGSCANCSAPLSGPYCSQCGQPVHVHRSLLHMGEELLHGILHFDGKALRTLPMLVAFPGQLTRRYIDGQRTRYVSPLALFLFMIFMMFFTASYTSDSLGETPAQLGNAVGRLEQQVGKARAQVATADARLAAARAAGGDTAALTQAAGNAREGLAEAEEALAAVRAVTVRPGAEGAGTSTPLNITTGIATVDAALKKAMKNPELTIYKLKNAASKFSFLLVPISLPFLWLMFFWKRNVAMYDHAVFALYSLSFMALMFVVIMLLNRAGFDGVAGVLFFTAPPLHMFVQLKGTYGLRNGSAVWRTLALLLAVSLVFLVYLFLIIILTVQ